MAVTWLSMKPVQWSHALVASVAAAAAVVVMAAAAVAATVVVAAAVAATVVAAAVAVTATKVCTSVKKNRPWPVFLRLLNAGRCVHG